jgi:hypothetical protein
VSGNEGGGLGSRVGYDLDNEQDREDRREHLELVSAVISRMAGASSSAKGWSVTVAGAAFGVAVVRASWFIFLLGVGALVVFGVLDGLYLHNEHKFRDLYDAIVQNSVRPLSMDTKNLKVRRRADSHRSWSVAGFYVPLAVAGVVLMGASIGKGEVRHEQPPNQRPSAPAQVSTSPSSAAPASPSANQTTATSPSTPATANLPGPTSPPSAPAR